MPHHHAARARRLPPRPALVALVALAALGLGAATPLGAQAQQPAPFTRRVDVSGVLFGSFQYHVEPGTDAEEDEQVRAGREQNQFSLDRAYVNVRAAVAPRTSVRVTSDLYRAEGGYELRVKYSYVDYRFLDRGDVEAFVRAGVLQNVVIDHEERFWPRWLGTAPLDRAGYFSSADVGLAVGATLPQRLGELYATVVNGQGYQRLGDADDRFKDWAARLSLTPFAGEGMPAVLRGVVVSPWAYWGDTASVFGPDSPRASTPGYLGALGAGRDRLRYGLFVGWEDDRFGTAGVSLSRRRSEIDAGENTAASPATTVTRTQKLASAFAALRPLALYDPSSGTPLSVVLRYDRHDANRAAPGFTHHVVAGLAYDLDDHLSVALDYQETLPQDGQPPTRATQRQIYFAHLQARF
jgi:hypothetical protein